MPQVGYHNGLEQRIILCTYIIMKATAQKKIVPNKVLVTGASGLLGVAAIEKFLSAGWDVVGASRRKTELPSGLSPAPLLHGKFTAWFVNSWASATDDHHFSAGLTGFHDAMRLVDFLEAKHA